MGCRIFVDVFAPRGCLCMCFALSVWRARVCVCVHVHLCWLCPIIERLLHRQHGLPGQLRLPRHRQLHDRGQPRHGIPRLPLRDMPVRETPATPPRMPQQRGEERGRSNSQLTLLSSSSGPTVTNCEGSFDDWTPCDDHCSQQRTYRVTRNATRGGASRGETVIYWHPLPSILKRLLTGERGAAE